MTALLLFLEQNWMTIAAVFLPMILHKLNINVPFVVPQPKAPGVPAILGLPAFPTTFGHGELAQFVLSIVAKAAADGTLKLPVLPQANAVQLSPDQVMQLLRAQLPPQSLDPPQP